MCISIFMISISTCCCSLVSIKQPIDASKTPANHIGIHVVPSEPTKSSFWTSTTWLACLLRFYKTALLTSFSAAFTLPLFCIIAHLNIATCSRCKGIGKNKETTEIVTWMENWIYKLLLLLHTWFLASFQSLAAKTHLTLLFYSIFAWLKQAKKVSNIAIKWRELIKAMLCMWHNLALGWGLLWSIFYLLVQNRWTISKLSLYAYIVSSSNSFHVSLIRLDCNWSMW